MEIKAYLRTVPPGYKSDGTRGYRTNAATWKPSRDNIRLKENMGLSKCCCKKMGISLEETSASNTLSKGIQENITEETANILASYINGIRADVSVKRALLEKWGNEILPKYNVIAEQQLTQLRAIANNTLRSAQNTEANVALVQEVRDMLSIVIDRSGRKIKI